MEISVLEHSERNNDESNAYSERNSDNDAGIGKADQIVGTVWSTYLTKYPDPQREFKSPSQICRKDDISYILPIASSCHFFDLPLRIFIDEPNSSVLKFLEGKNISLAEINRTVVSSNDERFFIYREQISHLDDDELILFADCSDVYFKRNPFDYLAKAPGIVFGEDVENTPMIGQNKYLVDKYRELARERQLSKSDISLIQTGFLVNAGVIGGKVKWLKQFLDFTCDYLVKWSHLEKNFNMPAVNLAANKLTFPVWVGKPFTSGFKKFEIDSAYYVVHK